MPAATHCSASSHGRRWETFSPLHCHLLPFLRVPFFSLPFCSSTGFFISTLQAAPFQSIISSTPTPALGEGGGWRAVGGHAKRCGIYLSFLAPVAGFHKALWPFSFTPSSLIPLPSSCLLSLPSNVFKKKKGHSGLSSEPVPVMAFLLLLSFHFYFKWAEPVGGTQDSQVAGPPR